MYYYFSILHILSLLLNLQHCYLFISFIYHHHYHYFTPHFFFSFLHLFIISSNFFFFIHYLDAVQSMYNFSSMLHLSSLLLHLQYCYLFISFTNLFHYHYFTTHFFFFLFFFSSFFITTQIQFRTFILSHLIQRDLCYDQSLIFISNIVTFLFHLYIIFIVIISHTFLVCISLLFLLSFLSFSSPFRFSSVNVLLLFNPSPIIIAPSSPILLFIYFIYISFSLSLYFCFFLFLFYSFFITSQIQCSQCTITFQSLTYHLCSFISNILPYLFHFHHSHFNCYFIIFPHSTYFFILFITPQIQFSIYILSHHIQRDLCID